MNKSIIRLVERAEKFGVSQLHRKGRIVYKVCNTGTYLELHHYGTKILVVDLEHKVVFKNECHGYSKSDQDAINTVLEHYGVKERASRLGGSMQVVGT